MPSGVGGGASTGAGRPRHLAGTSDIQPQRPLALSATGTPYTPCWRLQLHLLPEPMNATCTRKLLSAPELACREQLCGCQIKRPESCPRPCTLGSWIPIWIQPVARANCQRGT